MILINRFIPWITAFLALVLVEQIFLIPHQIFWLSGYLIISIVLSVWQLTGRRLRNAKFWRFLMTPLLFVGAGLLFLSFLKDPIIRQLLLFAYVVSIWLFLEVIYLRFNFRPKYQIHALENIFTHLELVTVFLTATGFLGLSVFLGLPFWQLALVFTGIVALFGYQVVWTSDTIVAVAWPYLVVVTLTVAELFYAVGYLPTSVYVGGLITAAGYYVITGLARNWLLGNKELNVVRRYAVIALVVAVTALVTAHWF